MPRNAMASGFFWSILSKFFHIATIPLREFTSAATHSIHSLAFAQRLWRRHRHRHRRRRRRQGLRHGCGGGHPQARGDLIHPRAQHGPDLGLGVPLRRLRTEQEERTHALDELEGRGTLREPLGNVLVAGDQAIHQTVLDGVHAQPHLARANLIDGVRQDGPTRRDVVLEGHVGVVDRVLNFRLAFFRDLPDEAHRRLVLATAKDEG
mmetsp:Transcript_9053/g.24459  ORF Transcript_9053/g.24459 Transcript_9053/m.24459 type:complete len:207 (-) Transcript_9053:440-1060(-)